MHLKEKIYKPCLLNTLLSLSRLLFCSNMQALLSFTCLLRLSKGVEVKLNELCDFFIKQEFFGLLLTMMTSSSSSSNTMVGNNDPDFLLPKLPEGLALLDEAEDSQSSTNRSVASFLTC